MKKLVALLISCSLIWLVGCSGEETAKKEGERNILRGGK